MERSKKEPSSQASKPQGIIPVSPVVVSPPKPAITQPIIEKKQTHVVKDSWDDVGFEAEAQNEWDADGWDNPSQEALKDLPAGKSSSVQPLNGHGDDDGWESFEENAEVKKEEVVPEPSLSTELEDSEFLEKQVCPKSEIHTFVFLLSNPTPFVAAQDCPGGNCSSERRGIEETATTRGPEGQERGQEIGDGGQKAPEEAAHHHAK